MSALTVADVLAAEEKLRENNVPPPYVLKTTRANIKSLLKDAMKHHGGAKLSNAALLSKGAPRLEPGERIVSRIGDTFIVVSK